MSNIMNMKDVRNHVHRSGFDLSQRNCFTAKVGEILPVYWSEVLPGDKVKIQTREFMRTAPVQTASFGRVRQYYDWYFVPYRLMWDKFPSWVIQSKNPYHAADNMYNVEQFGNHPYMLLGDMLSFQTNLMDHSEFVSPGGWTQYYGMRKLLSYLGYPSNVSLGISGDLALNPFPILAYQKIYQDYFRFAQWEDAAAWTYNLDYILKDNQTQIQMPTSVVQYRPHFFTLQCCNYDKDLFNGLLPSPQFGDTAIAGPIGGLTGNSLSVAPASPDNVLLFNLMRGTSVTDDYPIYSSRGSSVDGSYSLRVHSGDNTISPDPRPVTVPLAGGNIVLKNELSSASGLSVLLLRQAEALQKWKEITMSGTPDYKEQLAKHWGVMVSDESSYRCRYLGGLANSIDISEVINNNLSSDDARAEIAGKGVSAGQDSFSFESKEYGILMCVYHAKPIIEWNSASLLQRALTKTKATDYAIPEMDNIGMQSVLRHEFLYNSVSNWSQPIGYAPRYIEYKTKVDEIHGAFSDTLAPWVIPHQLSDTVWSGDLDYRAFKVSVDVLDNMFGVAARSNVEEVDSGYSTDQFYCTVYNDVKMVRNLSRDGLPY